MLRKKDGFIGERAYVLPPAYVAEMERHPLGSLLHFTDIGYYPTATSHYRQRDIPISQWVLIYCQSGCGWYAFDGRHFKVSPGQYFVLPAWRPHAYGADTSDPWTIYWVHYRGKLAHTFMPATVAPVTVKPDSDSSTKECIAVFENIMATLQRGYSHDALIHSCAALIYFLSALRHIDSRLDGRNVYDNKAGINKTNIVDSVIDYMTENIELPLRLSDLADFIGVTPVYLSHLFSAHTGQPPMKYLNQLRVRHACSLLDFSSLHVNQICHKVGIADPYYFSRLFTSIMGLPPTEYRKRPKG